MYYLYPKTVQKNKALILIIYYFFNFSTRILFLKKFYIIILTKNIFPKLYYIYFFYKINKKIKERIIYPLSYIKGLFNEQSFKLKTIAS